MIRKIKKNFGRGRRRHSLKVLRVLGIVVAISVILFPYTASYCDTTGSFRLINRTEHYLHVMIDTKQYTFIPPGAMITEDVNPYGGVTVDVVYSPGQGVKGRASKSFQAVIHTHTTETASESHDCSSTSTGGNDCNRTRNTSSSSTSTITVDPIEWQVTPADLSPVTN